MIMILLLEVLVVELSEADYNFDESENVTGHVITSPTATQEPIKILLLPLTIAEYNDMFPLPSAGPCNIPPDARPAQSKRFHVLSHASRAVVACKYNEL